ncbi:hypothetical protein Gocc_0917 [Gaiella occulta]|uniref:DUF1232 domain-containing protein n=1 Tax=Gaiella occulta TaxID=1002870 RepID=A0A7M2YYK8_9ACTN|nr:YkvA family protein [Gaiella occulta]RDI75119.1 hypothetical protein Gocc_0917 [Gaiella occulta]
MPAWLPIVAAVAAVGLTLYAAFVLALVAAGRREGARALAGFVPDCAVLCARLLRDPGVKHRHRLLLALLVAYLALPFDLVPDVIPVAGQLDDAIVVAVVLRIVLRGSGVERVRRHWPGPEASLRLVLRLAGAQPAP